TDWSVYLIRTRQGSLYTGIALNVEQRLQQHVSGQGGAKYLRAKGPLQVVYQIVAGDRALASRMEYRIKRLKKSQKEEIVAGSLDRQTLMIFLGLEAPG
ncbi:MAG: GIY-YIG nuclease family protein, partial [Cyanobacteria bacterium P01_A01_bin.105]